VAPNHIYIIPPNASLAIRKGTLHLSTPPLPHGTNLPIDNFFNSLATDRGEGAIGIILSGTGSDGTLGIRAIKEATGIVLVQNQDSAAFDGMPRNAIATGLADFILAPRDMPEKLIQLTKFYRAAKQSMPNTQGLDDNVVQKILSLIHTHTNHDFSLYKKNTIFRRIERRLSINQIRNSKQYLQLITESPSELEALFKELLIGVTNFFRDPSAFKELERLIMSDIIPHKSSRASVRAWIPGCSTGEEAYSIAILLVESMGKLNTHLSIQIFATDLDEDAINIARTGVYPSGISVDVTPERLRTHFTKTENGRYKINKNIRDMIVFAQQNVIQDPPFTRLDIISCRNLLIYFNQTLQKTIIPIFHYSLNENAILFLGSSESIGSHMNLFSVQDKKWKIFRRNKGHTHIPRSFNLQPAEREQKQMENDISTTANNSNNLNATQLIETILRESNAPPTVIIDHNYNVLYIHGKTGNYLDPAEGKGCMNFIDMARPEIKTPLIAAIRKTFIRKTASDIQDLPIHTINGPAALDVSLKPVQDQHSLQGLLLISFTENTLAAITHSTTTKAVSKASKKSKDIEHELLRTRQALQATIEEFETSDEELKATNEELQSTNEELQSTNEELETSKEELQSLNEESSTINAELQERIEGLNKANDDLKNLLDSTETATLFLDSNMKIRRYTPQMTQLIPLTPEDVGRPINHFASNLKPLNITKNALLVLNDLKCREYQVKDDDHAYIIRVRPYRKLNNVVDGVVITFDDNTQRLRTHNTLLRHQNMLNKTLNDTANMHALKDTALKYEVVNEAFCDFIGKKQEDILGKTDAELFEKNEAETRASIDKDVLLTKKTNTRTHTQKVGKQDKRFSTTTNAIIDTETNACIGLISSCYLKK
jgi:two-component system CheB/CheR fusion protein